MKTRESSRLSVFLVVLAVRLVYALGGGIRSNYGLLRGAIAASSGVDYAGVSFVLAAAQLAFGIMQPVFGAAALKTSSVSVLLCGAAMALLGLALTPLCRGLLALALTPLCCGLLALLLCFGILMPAGLGAFSFGLIMGAVTPLLGEKRAAAVSGVINASSGLGGILLALVLRGALDGFGLWGAIIALCLPLVCLVPVLLALRKADARRSESKPPLLRPLLRSAFHDRSYLLLSLAFFTCGFHMAIIETHLYTQFTACGFTEQSVTYAFSVYGIATMAGSFVSAWIGGLAVAATGGYTLIWYIDAALCLLAAACAFRVRVPAAGVEA